MALHTRATNIPAEVVPIDSRVLSQWLRPEAKPLARQALVEYRAFYPVKWQYRGEHFQAIIDASGGFVHASHIPAAKPILGDRLIALITLGLLFSEAILVPGLLGRLSAVFLTGLALFPILRWGVERHG